ncbi:DNase I-like protein [Cristinia sonorae]|uniref:DNase I-like protein n=1 Tax=Cristinia sonorae TaxID=1940300 RepID=A0A8K0XMR2_9AGAR|nr:DNase I-like protein [Cristinia sonorae]
MASQAPAAPAPSDMRTGVMSRLHALFPTSSPSVSQESSTVSTMTTVEATQPPAEMPKFIKIRMLTWNMYDSLPKGDLEELLGSARSVDSGYIPHDPETLPDLPADSNHPYHLVVVACQECPTVSGIPRGLGAPEFKRKDRDRDKSKEKDRDRDEFPERPHSRQQLLPDGEKGKDAEEKDKEPRERPRSAHRFNLYRDHSQHRVSRDDVSPSAGTSIHSEHTHHASYGWSAMLEEWYVNGGRHYEPVIGHAAPKRGMLDVPIADDTSRLSDEIPISPKAKSTGDLNARIDARTTYKGQYELLIKERMMGLYLAVFVNRDIKGLVRGTSKSSVTAGLIGGRVGNKGAIGVSVNLDGKTFLFINAHLAAHEGKMHHRLANLTKIQTELAVDSFLSSDDPRLMCEDLTDRFDHTFFCGDLNFRLDITRLHADWLISRKEYQQALAFDQLRKVMENGEAFGGFKEGNIDFPPTFKYDVLRTIKRNSKHSTRRPARAVLSDPLHEKILSEIEEQERDEHEALIRAEECEDEEEGGEATSIVSSVWTSVHSRYTVDADDQEEREHEMEEADEYFGDPQDTAARTRANVNPGANVVHKIFTTSAAHKAKAKWLSLIQSPSSDSPWTKMRKKVHGDNLQPPLSPTIAFRAATLPPTPSTPTRNLAVISPEEADEKMLKPSRNPGSGRLSPTKLQRHSNEAIDIEDQDKGVYDSSHKQRVPSWCDRILWKSTAEIRPYNVVIPGEESVPSIPPRTRMGQLFNAFRPNNRIRKDSYASVNSADSTVMTPSTSDAESSDHGHYSNSPSRPHIRQPRLSRSKSNDSVGGGNRDRVPVQRSFTHLMGDEVVSRPNTSPAIGISPIAPQVSLPYAVYKPQQNIPILLGDPSFTIDDIPPPVPPKDINPPSANRWLSNFLPFLSRDYTSSQAPLLQEAPPAPEPPVPPVPQKGEVVCLEYRTLDDKGMRRLEGRSDHRPVIGSYAVYI